MLYTKKFLATTITLAMAIVLLTGIAQAAVNLRPGYPPYDDVPGKLLNVAGLDPYAGYYSGYHAMFPKRESAYRDICKRMGYHCF